MGNNKVAVKTNGYQKRRSRLGWVFIAPFVLGFLLVYIKAFVTSIYYSFNEVQPSGLGDNVFIGWENYRQVLFVNTEFNKTVIGSIGTMFFNVPIILLVSLFLAVLLNQKMKGRAVFRMIFFLPVILATGIVASAEANNAVVRELWSNSGIETGMAAGGASLLSAMDIQNYLLSLNLSSEFVGYVIDIVNNIYNILNISGVQLLIFLAGLQSISPSVYEAAKIEGATGWEAFWKITLPMISPLIFLNLVYSIIDSFTNPQNELISLINTVGIKQGKFGIASAMGWIYTSITTVIVLLVVVIASKTVFKQENRR